MDKFHCLCALSPLLTYINNNQSFVYFNFSRNLSQLVETDPLKPIRAVIDAKTISFLSRLSHLFKLLRDQVLETKLIFRIQNQLALVLTFALSHQFSITQILVINVRRFLCTFIFVYYRRQELTNSAFVIIIWRLRTELPLFFE